MAQRRTRVTHKVVPDSQQPAPQPAQMPPLVRRAGEIVQMVATAPFMQGVALSSQFMRHGRHALDNWPLYAEKLAEGEKILFGRISAGSWGEQASQLYRQWRQAPSAAPNNLALLGAVLAYRGIPLHHRLVPAGIVAAILGDIRCDLPYHSHHHTRDVVCNDIRLTTDETHDEILTGFIAACVHDLGHDGRGNTLRDAHDPTRTTHIPFRLEAHAFDLAAPFLIAADITADALADISVMLRTTDVSRSKLTGGNSPAEVLRILFTGEKYEGAMPRSLSALVKRPRLTHLAMKLSSADLGVSAGLSYEYSAMMTALLCAENGLIKATPRTLLGFLDHICGDMVFPAAVKYFAPNMALIRKAARAAIPGTVYNDGKTQA